MALELYGRWSRKGRFADKRRRLMAHSNNNLSSQLQEYAKCLDAINEKRERIVKASRDLTYNSKKVIFQIHRVDASINKQAVLEQAGKDLNAVRKNYVQRIANELQGLEYWKFRKSFSPGVQEFVEAATVVAYRRTGNLLTLEEINESLSSVKDGVGAPFTVSLADYLLGVGDVTGEVMRLAISAAAAGDQASATAACDFVRSLYEGFSLVAHSDLDRDMGKKMETMRQSLSKIETGELESQGSHSAASWHIYMNKCVQMRCPQELIMLPPGIVDTACYVMHIRGSEYPPDLVALDLDCEGNQ